MSALRAIVEALNAGHAEAALATCRDLLRRTPDDPALSQLAATAAVRLELFEDAEGFARRSITMRPDHVPTLILAGRTVQAMGRHGEAAELFDRAAALAPDLAEAVFLSTAARFRGGEAPDLAALAAHFPNEGAAWRVIAEAALDGGHRPAALVCLDIAARCAPSFGLAMRRGLLSKELGRSAEAKKAFAEALALKPGDARAWFLFGTVSQDGGDMAAAEEAYARALALDPSMAEAAVNLGTVMQEQGDLDSAKAAYAQAVTTRADTFGRVAQAMTTSRKGELWLDLGRLRRSLGA